MRKADRKKAKKAPAAQAPDLARLEEVMKLLGRYELGELEWEKGGERIHLRAKGVAGASVAYASMPAMAAPSSTGAPASVGTPAAAAEMLAAANPKHKQVPSPFVGTFYRAASPTADPYVREGQVIKRGDVLCIIEAMKLMNEIEAEFPGKIVSVLVENGQPVEFGEPLFVVET